MSDRALRESFPGGKKETKGEQKDTKDGKGGQGSARADPDVTQDLPRLEQKHDQKEASSSLLGKGINMSKPVNDKDRKSMDTPLDPHLQSEQKSQMQSEQQPGQEPQKKSQQQQPSQQQDQRNQYSRTRKGATITPDQQTQSEQNRSNPKDATSSPDAQAQQKQDTSAEKGATAPPDLHAQGIPPTPFAATEEGKVELGNGLPALPPRPTVPLRKSGSSIPKHVPTVKQQVAQPQISIPPGSDLGIVGKIGAYQMSQTKPTSSATDIHANVYFWFYALTLFVTLFIMKKQK